MWCRVCNTEKQLKAFIPYNITVLCRHTELICLMCIVEAALKTGKCAYPGCGASIRLNLERTKTMDGRLRTFYPDTYKKIISSTSPMKQKKSDGIKVNLMTGACHGINVTLQDTVLRLKGKISEKLQVAEEKQKLLYAEKELSNYLESGEEAKLVDFGVVENASISLVIILYALPISFNHVTFDLFWGFPITGPDFLDASCLIYSGSKQIATVDFSHTKFKSAVKHSGDIMDYDKSIGHHTIEVFLKKMPKDVTHLFFTLSAWNSPTIGDFPNPSLKFFEASKPNEDLCGTTFTHAKESTAVVMCSVSRRGDRWHIFESGQLSDGNAKNYGPLSETVQDLIQRGV